jgi:hypothetical protein
MASLGFSNSEPLAYTSPDVHHHMSYSTCHYVNLTNWLGDNKGDLAIKVNQIPLLTKNIY